MVENLRCLNALEEKIWQSNQKVVVDEKSWKCWTRHQKIVMHEELVQNGGMNEKFVTNFVMSAKIVPKGCDGSVHIQNWWMEQSATQQSKFVGRFFDENEPWLLMGIPSRDSFLVTLYLERHSVSSDQHMKKLMSLREGLHVMMQCYIRQHFADRY